MLPILRLKQTSYDESLARHVARRQICPAQQAEQGGGRGAAMRDEPVTLPSRHTLQAAKALFAAVIAFMQAGTPA